MISVSRLARAAGIVLTASTLVLGTVAAEARPGGGVSSGSRGGRTYSAPAPTPTAPRTAQPMQRTETPNVGAPRPGPVPQAAQPGRFGGGFAGGLLTGLVGAGLLGALFGGGFFGGLSGLASLFGFLLQIGLILGLVWLALRLFRRRGPEPAFAGAGAPMARTGLGGALGGGSPRPAPGPRDQVGIGPGDYAAFERALVEIQAAYGREDVAALARLATPEMVRYFGRDLEENRGRGVRNDVSGARLLQGDLAEAWREGSTDYATVGMRFSVVDVHVDRASGRVVDGDPTGPVEVTEVWTFRRDGGGPWILSAIQQAG